MEYYCLPSLPSCNPELWRSFLGGASIEAWQLVFLFGVWAATMIIVTAITGAAVWAHQRSRA